MLKTEQSRANASVFRQFVSFMIAAIFFTQHLLIITPVNVNAAVSTTIVISQFQVAGGTAADEFIELHNVSNSSVDINGYRLVYRSAAGTSDVAVTDWTVSTVIPAGGYYLVANSVAGGYDDTVTANKTFTSGSTGLFAGASGGFALRNGAANTGVIVDSVGYGSATNAFVETATTSAPPSNAAKARDNAGCKDTDNGSADFMLVSPSTPRNNATTPVVCTGGTTQTNPSGIGSASPSSVFPGESTTLTVAVTPGANPASDGTTVTANLTAIGGSAAQAFGGNGSNFTFQAAVAPGTAPGVKSLPFTVADSLGRSTAGSISLTVNSPVIVPNHVVISQIYGGGGNSGASYSNDYVELYNPTAATVSLTGWTLQYTSATGSGWDGGKQPLGGAIAPGEYYLVGLGTNNSSTGSPLPAANVSGELNLSGNAGKVALVGNGDSLSGNCPLSDPDVVDFVGYGMTADCSEGNVDAPAPSNLNAIFRKSDGSQDTNVNGSDFVSQSAAPRRTATIAEIGPSVTAADPRNGFTNSPRDSSLTITFTEPVNVDPQWFSVSCAVTGAHNDATIASYNNGKNYVITPNVNFQAGETCAVTINKDSVHDQDTDDSAPNTDTLTTNYSWSFTIATGTAPQYAPDVHLTMGNPTDAAANVGEPNNYLMEKPEFTLSYNRDRGTPNWVSWHLDDSWVGNLSRVDTFRPDPAVPSDWYRVQATDYFSSGFDRGHMVPNADRDKETSSPINQATFLMTNMIPQAPDNNQGPWANLENYLRTLLAANELYIVAGGAGTGGTGSNGGVTTTIADGKVTVPEFTWKVALVIPKADGDDIGRVSASTKTIAVIMPNRQGIRTNNPNDWQAYLTSVDQVEKLTGYDFYENLPDAVENSVEAGIDGVNPPGTANQTISVAEDNSTSIALDVAGSGDLTYEIVNQPKNGSLAEGTGGTRTYMPNLNFNGTDSFTFRVKQGTLYSNVSTVSINVTAVNDDPTVGGDEATVVEDSGANTVDVLGNDSSLPETGEVLTVTSVTQGANGSVVITNGGTNVSYTPNANFSGADSFAYTIGDGNGGAATGTVKVSVTAVNDAPTITGGTSLSRQQNAVGSIAPIAAVSDVDNAASGLTVTVLKAPTGIVLSNIANDNGTITATVAATCAATLGTNTVVLQVSDGKSIATANLTVTVAPSNAPVINLKPFTTLSLPNRKYLSISMNQMVESATDDCNGNVAGNVVIERVTSDEAENGEDDGDTLNDIVIGEDCKTVQLRAERSGVGNGRVYTVTLRVGDSSGNITRASYKVFVPVGDQTPIDDGAVYTVDSNCP